MRKVLLALVALLIACSSDDDDASSVTPEQACDSAANALCDKIQECAPAFASIFLTDKATCVSRLLINCPKGFSAPGNVGTPAQLAACADQARAAACDDILGRNTPESCRTIAGTLEDGAACGSNGQCKGKLCRTSGGATCGACSSVGAAGAACTADDECDYGLKCEQNKCIAYGKAGNACNKDQPCLPSLGCIDGVCSTPLATGASCTFKQGENPCSALKGEWCHPTRRVCEPFKQASAGGDCGVVGTDAVLCTGSGTGAFCKLDGQKGKCIAPANDGAGCNDQNGPHCIPPAHCVGGVCTISDPASCK
jgi:hypothetical protein